MPIGIYKRIIGVNCGWKHTEKTKKKIGKRLKVIARERGFGKWMKGKKHSEDTIKKMRETHKKNPTRFWLGKKFTEEHKKKIRLVKKGEKNPNWKGGITPYQAHRRWVKKHPEHMAHLKARRDARQRNAKGSHSFEEWQNLCKKHNWRCAKCNKRKKLTKDHIIPLSKGGSDNIENIQPLCKGCNSKKYNKIIKNDRNKNN